jgi:hypothetical protein
MFERYARENKATQPENFRHNVTQHRNGFSQLSNKTELIVHHVQHTNLQDRKYFKGGKSLQTVSLRKKIQNQENKKTWAGAGHV